MSSNTNINTARPIAVGAIIGFAVSGALVAGLMVGTRSGPTTNTSADSAGSIPSMNATAAPQTTGQGEDAGKPASDTPSTNQASAPAPSVDQASVPPKLSLIHISEPTRPY